MRVAEKILKKDLRFVHWTHFAFLSLLIAVIHTSDLKRSHAGPSKVINGSSWHKHITSNGFVFDSFWYFFFVYKSQFLILLRKILNRNETRNRTINLNCRKWSEKFTLFGTSLHAIKLHKTDCSHINRN